MAISIKDQSTNTTMGVDSNRNGLVNTPVNSVQAGFTAVSSESDSGALMGGATNRLARPIDSTDDYRLRVGIDNHVMTEIFPGTTLNSSIWTAPVSNMTVTLPGSGFAVLNASGITTANSYAQLRTYRHFDCFGSFTTWGEFRVQFPYTPQVNDVCEFGFGLAATNAAPTDGAFFRTDAAGLPQAVVNYNGTETTQTIANWNTLVPVNTTHHFIIGITEDIVRFWIDNQLVAAINAQTANGTPTSSQQLPVFFRTYTSASTAPTQAQQIKIGFVSVSIADMNNNKQWATMQAGMGNMGYQYPTGSATQGRTAVWTNNTAPTATLPTNTTAAFPAGLGGLYLVTLTGLATATDYITSSYQVPLGTAAMPGGNLVIMGVKVSSVNLGVANGSTPLVLSWGLAYGHTAVSLATTESAISKAPRFVPIGNQAWVAAAPVGAVANDIVWNFTTPIVVQPGEFIQLVFRAWSYVSTASQTMGLNVMFDAFWE